MESITEPIQEKVVQTGHKKKGETDRNSLLFTNPGQGLKMPLNAYLGSDIWEPPGTR